MTGKTPKKAPKKAPKKSPKGGGGRPKLLGEQSTFGSGGMTGSGKGDPFFSMKIEVQSKSDDLYL